MTPPMRADRDEIDLLRAHEFKEALDRIVFEHGHLRRDTALLRVRRALGEQGVEDAVNRRGARAGIRRIAD